MIKSNNPALKFEKFFSINERDSQPMSIQGTITKTLILLLMLVASASLNWYLFIINSPWASFTISLGFIGSLATGFYTLIRPQRSHISAPLYAVFQGFVLSWVSMVAEKEVPGVGLCSVYLTFATLAAMLLAYKLELIKVNETFKGVMFSCLGGISLVYSLSLVLRLFGTSIPFIESTNITGIVFSLFVVAVAALSLVADFDFIYQASGYQLPKRAEWYAGFSLMVSLIWLYMEIVRLLIKLSRRR